MLNFTETIDPYIPMLYIIHIIISFLLAIFLTLYIKKRFLSESKEIDEKDLLRLEEIALHSYMFRLFFKVSLHKNNRITSFLFLFIFNVAMPILGYPLSIWTAYYLRNVKYDKKVSNTNILNLDEFSTAFLKVERIFGEGSLIDLMTSDYAPKSKKLKALSALSSRISPANLKVVRQTLSSTDDEIRMFGYAILNKAEKSINSLINQNLTLFNTQDEGTKEAAKIRANSAKELAFLYWELVYTELSHDSLKENFLVEVQKYIEIARAFYLEEIMLLEEKVVEYEAQRGKIEDEELLEEHNFKMEVAKDSVKKAKEISTRLYILMGRVYMGQNKYEKAKIEFTVAQEIHEGELTNVIPYLAEIYFLTGNYKVVNSIMSQAKDLKLNATLYPIVQQWNAS